MVQPDIYISADIESDGPIPGPYSMLSFGLAVAARFDGRLEIADPEKETFYRELQPISDQFQPEAVEVTGFNRDELKSRGTPPEIAMVEARRWIIQVAGDHHPVLVAYPLGFDWLFLYWYLVRFSDSPIEFSSGLDMKTMYQQKARVPLSLAGRSDLPSFLRSQRSHTHNALDDAIEQAEIFVKLFEWRGH